MKIARNADLTDRLMRGVEQLSEAAQQQRMQARLHMRDQVDRGGRAESGDKSQSRLQSMKGGPVDLDAFPNLQKADDDAIMAAWENSQTLQEGARRLHTIARHGPRALLEDAKETPARYARAELEFRERLSDDVAKVLDLAADLGDAVPGLPVEDLEALHARLQQDIRDLQATHGSKLVVSERALMQAARIKRFAGHAPNPGRLPESKRLEPGQVDSAEAAAGALATMLDDKDLADSLVAIRQKVPEHERPKYDTALAAFALLVDESRTAPDYARARGGARDRSSYRARRAAGWTSGDRQQSSLRTLGRALSKVVRAARPLQAMRTALSKELTRELGVPGHASADWAPTIEGMHQALADEAFVPLRALVERAPGAMYTAHRVAEPTTEKVVHDLVRSVVEGRYAQWRATNPGSAAQLAPFSKAQQQAWLTPHEASHDIVDERGQAVTIKSREATAGSGHEVFWSTKIGGASHAFDTMTQCALAAYTNTRSQVLLTDDPRWPTFSGRAYLRLAQDPASGDPIMYLEGLKEDVPYDGDPAPLERVLVEHALKKAAAMGAQLTLSQNLLARIEDMDLPGQWRTDQVYDLAPALLVEAASIFGSHDWVQTKSEQRRMRDPQFHVDMAQWAKD